MGNTISGYKSEKLDKLSLDITNESEQINLYLSKIEDEIENLKNDFDIPEVRNLKQHFSNLKSNFQKIEYNMDKTAQDLIKVKAHYSKTDSNMADKVSRAINNIN